MSDLCPVAVSQHSGNLAQQPKTAGESHLLLLKQKKYCDVTFKFPNQPTRIAAHEIHLKARSPVFEQIFRMRKSGNVQGDEIEISESTPETFQQFLEYIYADKFEADIAGALGLLQLAQKYKIQPLTEKCEQLLRTEIKAKESVKVFEAARCHGRQDLMDRAAEIIVKSFSNLMETGALANAEEATLVYLLERDDLTIEEVKLFQLILDWARSQVECPADESNFKDTLKNVISKIRYTNMTLLEFTKVVVPTGLLSAEESLSVYSYLSGDEATRAALKIKFNTTGRKLRKAKVEKFIDFFAETPFQLDWAPAFYDQSLGFQVERLPQAQVVTRKESSGCLRKTAVISKIKLLWPQTHTIYGLSASLNVKIYIIDYSGVPLYFQKELVGCKPGASNEIDVKPPVKLIPGRMYAVTVKNDSTYVIDKNFRNDSHAYFGQGLSSSEFTATRDLLLENSCLYLKETHMETRNYTPPEFSHSPFNLVLIKGITIELV